MTSAHDNSTLSRCMFVKDAALAGLGAAVAGNSGALFGSVPAASAVIADNYNSVMENYGPEAFYLNYCTGNYGMTARPWQRLLATCGGYTTFYGNYSLAQLQWITPYMWGSAGSGSLLMAARDSDLVLMCSCSVPAPSRPTRAAPSRTTTTSRCAR